MSGTQHLSNQGENSPWTEQDMGLPSIDELSGVGQAQHLADTGVNSNGGDAHERRDRTHDGLAALGEAVDMMQPSASYLDVPELTLTRAGDSSLKRSSSIYEDHMASKRACADFDMHTSGHGMDVDDVDGEVQCPECGKMKRRPCDLR